MMKGFIKHCSWSRFFVNLDHISIIQKSSEHFIYAVPDFIPFEWII